MLVGFAAVPSPLLAQGQVPDLGQVSIEDLMNIKVTSVSHKEQRVADVAAAVSVITQEDIWRSGMTTVPELLGLVPGMQVPQSNSDKWAVSARVQQPVRRQAAGAGRRPDGVRPAQLRALLGIVAYSGRPD